MKEFKFWKDNKVDQKYTLTLDEIKAKYKEYLSNQELEWIQYYGNQTVNFFISSEIGLKSVTETENYTILQSELMSVRHEFYP